MFQRPFDGWHEKTQDKDPKYPPLGHNEAMADWSLSGTDRNNQDHTIIHLGCRRCTGGK